jgi:vacuolar-type H+-ATPase subunit I/STV1
MARAGISQEQVIEAIETLMQAGHPVTVSSVRDHLGSGSYSTISTHLAKWREANDNRKTPDYPDMPDNVDKAFRQVWAMAWKNAQETIQAEREALAAARKQMEQEQRDMEAEITRLEAESAAQGDEVKRGAALLSEKEKALSAAQNAINELKIDNARLDERSKSAENRAGELKEELDKLHTRFQEATEKAKKL